VNAYQLQEFSMDICVFGLYALPLEKMFHGLTKEIFDKEKHTKINLEAMIDIVFLIIRVEIMNSSLI